MPIAINDKHYSLRETLVVVREVHKIISSTPEMLQIEGVFRMSGDKNHIGQILESILHPGSKDHENKAKYTIHDYLAAFKEVIMKREDKLENLVFNQAINDILSKKSPSNFSVIAEALIQSEQLDNLYLAEILYTYYQVALLTIERQRPLKNKMDFKGFATLIAPSLSIIKESMEEIHALMEHIAALSDFSTLVLSAKEIQNDKSFLQYLSEQHPDLIDTVQKLIKREIETQKHFIIHCNFSISQLTTEQKLSKDKIDGLNKLLKAVELSLEQFEEKRHSRAIHSKRDDSARIKAHIESIKDEIQSEDEKIKNLHKDKVNMEDQQLLLIHSIMDLAKSQGALRRNMADANDEDATSVTDSIFCDSDEKKEINSIKNQILGIFGSGLNRKRKDQRRPASWSSAFTPSSIRRLERTTGFFTDPLTANDANDEDDSNSDSETPSLL